MKVADKLDFESLSVLRGGVVPSQHIELAGLHKKLIEKNDAHYNTILFDLEDFILRISAESSESSEEFLSLIQDPSLRQKIEIFRFKGSRFANSKERLSLATDDLSNRPVKVLKLSLENEFNKAGGVAAVLKGLNTAHKRLGIEKVYSLHPLLSNEKPAALQYAFQGVIQHLYNGRVVQSSIYKNRKDSEYLIQPDPEFYDLFDTPIASPVYGSNANSNLSDRILYFGSAAAAFSHQYIGKTGAKNIDIVHIDSPFISGCALPLISQMNERRKATMPQIKKVFVMHGGLDDCLYVPATSLKKIGIQTNERGFVDLISEGLKTSDEVVFVSSRRASEALSEDPALSHGRDEILKGSDKVSSIRNGIASEKFDVTNRDVFKEFALERTFDKNGIETTDYVAYRTRLKEALFQAGVIADPTLPLVIYVGRYAVEKGIDVLVDVIKNTDSSKAQFVTMGINFGQDHLVNQLQEMGKTSHKNSLRCMTTLDQQKANFTLGHREYEVSVGQLIRAAADAFIVPSHAEACGLVAMEGQCAGSLLIAPYHEGLMDICKPDGFPNGSEATYSLTKDANALCYKNHADAKQASRALNKGLSSLDKMTKDEKNQFARRIRNEAIPNYSWYYDDKESGVITGASVAYHQLYDKLVDRPIANLISEPSIVAPEQIPIQPIPYVKPPFFVTVARKIVRFVKRLFFSIGQQVRYSLSFLMMCLRKTRNFFLSSLQGKEKNSSRPKRVQDLIRSIRC